MQEKVRAVVVMWAAAGSFDSARRRCAKVDSETLAHLSRTDLLPEAWIADGRTQQMRLLTRLRITLGQQRAKAKNQLQAVLHQEGFLKPVTEVFGKKGRAWLAELKPSVAARIAVDADRRLGAAPERRLLRGEPLSTTKLRHGTNCTSV